MANAGSIQLAVVGDADNTIAGALLELLEEVAEYDTVTIRWACGGCTA